MIQSHEGLHFMFQFFEWSSFGAAAVFRDYIFVGLILFILHVSCPDMYHNDASNI